MRKDTDKETRFKTQGTRENPENIKRETKHKKQKQNKEARNLELNNPELVFRTPELRICI